MAGLIVAAPAPVVPHIERIVMVNVVLLARLEAKPGKEAAVADLLRSALPLPNAEPPTVV
jgi:hypothetical protein